MATLTTSWKSYASASFTGGNATVTFYLEAKYSSQSVANNTTAVQTRLRSAFTSGNSLYGQGYKFTCTYCNTVSGSGYWYFGNEVITSGSSTVTHSSDGSKSITLSASAYSKAWGFTKNLSATVSLPKIDRLAEVTSGSNFNDSTTSLNINFKNPGNFNTRCYLNFYTSNGGTLAHQELESTIKKWSSPYTWDLASRMDNILQDCNTQTTYYMREGIDTYNGSTKLGAQSLAYTFTITDANPVINNVTFQEQNSDVINYLGSSSANTLIAGVSSVLVTADVTLKKYATKKIFSFQPVGSATGVDYQMLYNVPETDGNSIVFLTNLRDSRNLDAETYSVTKTVIPYRKVKQNSFSFKRVNPTSSNVRLKVDSVYYQQTFGSTPNAPVVKYKIGEQGSWITVPSSEYDIDNVNHKLEVDYIIQNAIDYRSSGTFYLEVSDLFSSWNNQNPIYKGIPVFEFGDDEVQVNGDLLLADTNRENVIDVKSMLSPPNIMTIYLQSDYAMPNTNTAYDLTNMAVAESVGNKLSLSGGKIVIGAGVSKVKVSYTAKTVSAANTTRTFTYLMQDINGTATAISQEGSFYSATNQQVNIGYQPRVVSVSQGDTFYLRCYGYKNNYIAGATSTFMPTFLTVEVIE